MKRLVVVVVALGGCISSNSATCPDGQLCPAGTVCDPHDLCVLADQLSACDGKQPADACTFVGGAGHCLDGVCLTSTCGDRVVEFGEICDPSDDAPCSADCTSDLKCGNGVIDIGEGETCDDSNFLDNDGCSSACLAELPHWIHHTLTPGPRSSVGMTFDFRRGRIVGFGGSPGGPSYADNETLEWTGADWAFQPVNTIPPARSGAGIAFDIAHGQTVMFGGFDSAYSMRDTWLWDGTDWHGVSVAGPDPRSSHIFVYDPKREVSVMFGGYGDEDGDHDDTWEWDGTTWTHVMTPSPPARELAQAAYDPKHGVIVMTGGYNGNGAQNFSDTWTYDGTWHNVTPPVAPGSSPQIDAGAMAWDPASQKLILFGGVKVATQQSSVWAWNGTTWTALAAMPMGARAGLTAVNTGNHIVVFGGTNQAMAKTFDDSWFYANGVWTQPAAIGPRNYGAAFNEVTRRDAIIFGGATNYTSATSAQTWQLGATGNQLRANAPPSARMGACIAWDPAKNDAVMFGGAANLTPVMNNETWIWSGAGWTQVFPAHSPSARFGAACAFDGKTVTLVGGAMDSISSLADAYSWDGTDWTSIALPSGFAPRTDAEVAYDPIRKVMVLHGGTVSFSGTSYADTWVYDGVHATWTPAAEGFKPNGRHNASLAWNPARHRLVLVGGIAVGTDSYEWDGSGWSSLPVGTQPASLSFQQATSSFDGGGVSIYGGTGGGDHSDGWELRWEASRPHEQCDGSDLDGDGLVGCADPDCWSICTPLCMPGVPNCDPMTGPTCGDGVCDPTRENAHTCSKDCTAPAVCGDGYCDAGETGCPGDCP